MTGVGDTWASDVPVSLPEPVDGVGAHIPMFGFVFTEAGLFHDLNQADHERLSTPTFAPPVDPANTVVDSG
jgi:hypothetical protein